MNVTSEMRRNGYTNDEQKFVRNFKRVEVIDFDGTSFVAIDAEVKYDGAFVCISGFKPQRIPEVASKAVYMPQTRSIIFTPYEFEMMHA